MAFNWPVNCSINLSGEKPNQIEIVPSDGAPQLGWHSYLQMDIHWIKHRIKREKTVPTQQQKAQIQVKDELGLTYEECICINTTLFFVCYCVRCIV